MKYLMYFAVEQEDTQPATKKNFSIYWYFTEELIIEASPSSTSLNQQYTAKEYRNPNNEDILSLIQLAENSSLLGTMLLEEAINVSNEITSTSKIASVCQ